MAVNQALHVYLGFDDRESVATDVCAHSIRVRTKTPISIKYLKHRELASQGLFHRPWATFGPDRETYDMIDGKKFSTQFSHTRFLVPALMNHKGWALFMDGDMIVLNDISKLFEMADDRYAVMCVKHNHTPPNGAEKMDGREQLRYHRKNWSSFTLWNCGHPANAFLTSDKVNCMLGSDLHGFSWLKDSQIGSLPFNYNYIVGVSPNQTNPDVVHYTDGGPWFPECKEVALAQLWVDEYEDWQAKGDHISSVPTKAFEEARK